MHHRNHNHGAAGVVRVSDDEDGDRGRELHDDVSTGVRHDHGDGDGDATGMVDMTLLGQGYGVGEREA